MRIYDLNLNKPLPKLSVFELSSTGVKMIYIKDDIASSESWPFYFTDYKHDQIITNTFSYIEDGRMNVKKFNDHVLPAIRTLKNRVRKVDITDIYPVGTAAYRVINKGEISELLKQILPNRLDILRPEEEILATLSGFINVKPKYFSYTQGRNYLMIDQGGGSTELIFFNEKKTSQPIHIDLGSQILKIKFFML